jgi:hypothetical protein
MEIFRLLFSFLFFLISFSMTFVFFNTFSLFLSLHPFLLLLVVRFCIFGFCSLGFFFFLFNQLDFYITLILRFFYKTIVYHFAASLEISYCRGVFFLVYSCPRGGTPVKVSKTSRQQHSGECQTAQR